ncbi:MAG: hypothetical protein JO157_08135 [Acetobacteraceae bacterium]|nr:hypothetical protein [Acetobacteraceae bacterium]
MGILPTFEPAAPFPGRAALKVKRDRLLRRWHRSRARRERIARFTRELQAYTDRELNELGLDRADIPAVARGTYRRA